MVAQEGKCWSCGAQGEIFPSCAQCRKLQPFPEWDHFTLFGLDPSLMLEDEDLRRRYYRLCRAVHPDLYPPSKSPEDLYAAQWTTAVNKAYRDLKSPEGRALYLLRLFGRDSEIAMQPAPLALAEALFELEDSDPEALFALLEQYRNALEKKWDLARDAWQAGNSQKALDQLVGYLAEQRYLRSMEARLQKGSPVQWQ